MVLPRVNIVVRISRSLRLFLFGDVVYIWIFRLEDYIFFMFMIMIML
jgi:hypothetical protein